MDISLESFNCLYCFLVSENVGESEGLSDTSIILIIIGGCVVGSIGLVLLCYWCTKGCESFFNCCKRCVMNIHTERKKAKGNKNSSKYYRNNCFIDTFYSVS